MSSSSDLRQKATSGVFWSAVERFGQQAVAFIIQLILARLLAPEEFGLIAMVAVFIAISGVLIDAGFSRALIQRKEVTDSDLSTVFYFNLAVSVLMAAALYAVAPTIADFYSQNELMSVLRVLSLGLVISAFGAVHRTILERNLQFKKIFWVSFPSTILSGGIGLALAFNGYGVWALVAQMLAVRMIGVTFLWFQSGWRPALVFDSSSLREMLPYGSRLAFSSFLDQGFQNLYVLVIGRAFSAVEVGFFQRARAFQKLPVQNLNGILGRVAFPLFASVQDDPDRLRRAMCKAIQMGCLFLFPTMALLAVSAEPAVLLLIGEKWLPCVPYLQWLCAAGALYPLHSMNLNFLTATGRSDLFLRLEIIKKVLTVGNIALTFRFGIQVMIYGMIVTSFLSLLINTFYTKKLLNYGLCQQIKDLRSVLFLTVAVFLGTFTLSQLLVLPPFILLSALCLSSGLIFVSALRFFDASLKREISMLLERLPLGCFFIRVLL
jgi:teichuronic acid exporter